MAQHRTSIGHSGPTGAGSNKSIEHFQMRNGWARRPVRACVAGALIFASIAVSQSNAEEQQVDDVAVLAVVAGADGARSSSEVVSVPAADTETLAPTVGAPLEHDDDDCGRDDWVGAPNSADSTVAVTEFASAEIRGCDEPRYALTLDKVVSNAAAGPFHVGDTVLYSITAKNTGNASLSGVAVSDPKVADLVCDRAMPTTLSVNAEIKCTASHVVTSGDVESATYDNTASVKSNQLKTLTDTATAPLVAPVTTLPPDTTIPPDTKPDTTVVTTEATTTRATTTRVVTTMLTPVPALNPDPVLTTAAPTTVASTTAAPTTVTTPSTAAPTTPAPTTAAQVLVLGATVEAPVELVDAESVAFTGSNPGRLVLSAFGLIAAGFVLLTGRRPRRRW